MEKVERDGKVAVLYSPDFCGGWSTCDSDSAEKVFCPRLVLAVLGESGEDREAVAQAEFPDAYQGAVADLQVEWVKKGSRFEIDEYDGRESVRVFGPDEGHVA